MNFNLNMSISIENYLKQANMSKQIVQFITTFHFLLLCDKFRLLFMSSYHRLAYNFIESCKKTIYYILNLFHDFSKRFSKLNNKHVSTYLIYSLLTSLCLLTTVNASNESRQQSTYKLTASSNSYVQYLPWHPCHNGTLIFEFKTSESNGLLMYAQSLPYKYIQISLTDGYVRARFRISERDSPRGVFLVNQKVKLNDDMWHEVQISRVHERTVLTIDGESLFHIHKDANLESYDLYFGDHPKDPNYSSQNNLLYFGGLPNSIQTFDLSLGTALFEQRYNGFFRNVRALNCSSPLMSRLNVISSNNLRFMPETDACMSSPCLNNGVCSIDSSNQFKCDCRFTNYEGSTCEILKPPRTNEELTFMGKEYFSFELPSGTPYSITYEEEFNIDFKTSRSTGLLFYSGDSHDYLALGLQDGTLYFKLNIKGQIFERTLTIPDLYLHNNHWHTVKFSRKIKQVDIYVDNIKKDSSNITGEFIAMQTRIIYIGGAPHSNAIYRTIHKNFIGCLRNVTFKTETLELNMIDLALNNSVFIKKYGNIERGCKSLIEPVTFSSPNSYIPVLEWKDYPKFYSFSIEFQTTENYGILAYILGSDNTNKQAQKSQDKSKLLSLNKDFFSLEIHNRFLNAYFNLGTSYIRHEIVNEHVSTGKSHQITVEINEKHATFKFDQRPATTIRIDAAADDKLDLSSPLIIGGLYSKHRSTLGSNPSQLIPPYFYSGMLEHGFVGCIQEVEVNGQFVNLTHYAKQEGVSGLSTEMCTPMPNQCEIGNCMNDGVCLEGWNRFVCDCSSTGFNGPICNQPATIAEFAEGQLIQLLFTPEWVSEAEHVSLRFKTHKKQNALIFTTHSPSCDDKMEVSLENTQIKLFVKIGKAEISLFSSEGLCDNKWHTFKILRESNRIILQVDNDEPATGMFGDVKLANELRFHFTLFMLGSSFNQHFLHSPKYRALSYSNIDLGKSHIKKLNNIYRRSLNSFVGKMQQLVINGKSYFELIDNGDLKNSVNRTVTFTREDLPHRYPITFHNTHSWLSLPKIDAYHILLIQFHFKTNDENGLILYNKGHDNDYIAIELVDGQINYAFSMGGPLKHRIKSNLKQKLNDNKWHLVSIWRSTKTNHELSVDSVVYKYSSNQTEQTVLYLIDQLYLGSLKSQEEYELLKSKNKIVSNHGYRGCLASFEINGRAPDFEAYLNKPSKMKGNITKGCQKPTGCSPTTCLNGGTCVEKWETNKIFCNCELTSFTGKHCEFKSKGYSFNKSQINFEYKSPLYWQQQNHLAFGIETTMKDATLFKSFNARNNETILVELINGYPQVTFTNLHGIVHLHTFKNYSISDNKYHVIRFVVLNFNSTLDVDNVNAQKKIIPENQQITYKKSQVWSIHSDPTVTIVEIGGSNKPNHLDKNPKSSSIPEKFIGKIYGLVYNYYRILDLLSQDDSRVKTFGQLNLIDQESFNSIRNASKIECKDYYSKSYDCLDDQIDSYEYVSSADFPNQENNGKFTDSKKSDANNSDNKNKSATKGMSNEQSTSSTNQAITPQVIAKTSDLMVSDLTTAHMIGIIAAVFLILLFVIIIIYKYRNREEGTYTIDESKNFGPFAELNVPLNGSKESKKTSKSRGIPVENKEWYV